jgi:hypothetical protein
VAASYLIVAVFLYACSKKPGTVSDSDESLSAEPAAQPA